MNLPREPVVIWPAPGLPAFLEPHEAHFELIVAHTTDSHEDLRDWAGSMTLRQVGGEVRHRLQVDGIYALGIPINERKIHGFTALPFARGLSFARIRLRVLERFTPVSPATVALYDLLAGAFVARSRAVAVWREQARSLTLAFVSDLHLAAFWDVLSAAVDRHAPDLAEKYLNPRRFLERFVCKANSLWARGQLDLIVLGGDLVESVYAHRGGGTLGDCETNVQLLVQALAGLRVPTVAIVGNHDHRAFPWRPRAYGLRAVGIPPARTKKLLKAARLWDQWPVRPADLQALRTHDDSGTPALAQYLALVAPATDFALTLRGLRLICASTGADLLPGWRQLERGRLGLFLRTLRSTWNNPDSEGLYDDQLHQIAAGLSGQAGAALFFHAPLLHADGCATMGTAGGLLDPGDTDNLTGRVAFECRLRYAGLRGGVLFRNPGPLLRTLLSANGSVVSFSGHVHHATAIELDRRTLRARAVAIGAPDRPLDTVTLVTAPALGQQWTAGYSRPGYLLARFHEGALVGLDQHDLGT